MKKLKILFVDHAPFLGGAQLRLASHLKFLDQSKFTPFVITSKSSKYSYIYQIKGVGVYKINFDVLKRNLQVFKSLFQTFKEFRQVIEKIKPDIIFSNTTRALIVTSLAKKKYPLISFIWDYDYPLWVLKLLKIRVNKFLTVSNSIKNYYSLKKAQTVYLGSDLDFSTVTKAEILKLRKRFGIRKEDIVIGFVGRLVKWKGALVVLEALKTIDHPKLKLLIFGTGKDQKGNIEDKLKSEIFKNNLKNRVKLTGFFDNQALIYKSLDIFVLASILKEPFATSMIEAASAKLPIVATNTGGTPEFVKHKKNGLMISPNDSIGLAQALTKLLNKKYAKTLAEQAFLDAKKFQADVFTRKLEEVYIKVVFQQRSG